MVLLFGLRQEFLHNEFWINSKTKHSGGQSLSVIGRKRSNIDPNVIKVADTSSVDQIMWNIFLFFLAGILKESYLSTGMSVV